MSLTRLIFSTLASVLLLMPNYALNSLDLSAIRYTRGQSFAQPLVGTPAKGHQGEELDSYSQNGDGSGLSCY